MAIRKGKPVEESEPTAPTEETTKLMLDIAKQLEPIEPHERTRIIKTLVVFFNVGQLTLRDDRDDWI